MSDLYEVLFKSVRKDILSLCSGVVFLIIKRDLFITSFQKQNKKKNKLKRLLRR